MPVTGILFLNRNSGARAGAEELEATAAAAGLETVVIAPDSDCAAIVRERMREGVSLFIAAGGDGTVHYVLQALVNSHGILAVIPLGTYNHFARDLDIPLDWREALKVALEGDLRQVDAARVNDRYFVNNLSLGLYPDLVTRREQHGRDYPRWKARLFAFAATLRRYRHVTLAVQAPGKEELIRTHVFMVSNNSYDLGRFGIEAPRETLTEGSLAVYWLPHTSRLKMARVAARYLAGRVRRVPGFRSFRTTHMRVQSAKSLLDVGVDGEVFKLQTPLIITIVPRSLKVRVLAR